MSTEVVIGLHLFQPPREATHPKLTHVKTDPFGQDWTAIITDQCYKPLAELGILGRVSFDIYGILRDRLRYLDPNTAAKVTQYLSSNGVGDPYLHALLPDLSDTDKRILIASGQRKTAQHDFQPKWFWAAEAALDARTLEILSEYGYQGVICAPEQLQTEYNPYNPMDHNLPTKIKLKNGAQIIALPFDRPLSGQLAFGNRTNADYFATYHFNNALRRRNFNADFAGIPRDQTPIVTWVDGETFGHHDRGGHLFLDYLTGVSLPEQQFNVIPINQIDTKSIAAVNGKLNDRTSWSCPHGDLIRWHGSCNCGSGNLQWKSEFYRAHHLVNGFLSQLLASELDTNYSQQVIDNFESALDTRDAPTSPLLMLIAAKISALQAVNSCGTFFDDPGTSGLINVLFAVQAIHCLRDAGLHKKALRLERVYTQAMHRVTYVGPDYIRTGNDIINDVKKQIA